MFFRDTSGIKNFPDEILSTKKRLSSWHASSFKKGPIALLYVAILQESKTVWSRNQLYEGVPRMLCLNLMSLRCLMSLLCLSQTVLGSCSSYQSLLLLYGPCQQSTTLSFQNRFVANVARQLKMDSYCCNS